MEILTSRDPIQSIPLASTTTALINHATVRIHRLVPCASSSSPDSLLKRRGQPSTNCRDCNCKLPVPNLILLRFPRLSPLAFANPPGPPGFAACPLRSSTDTLIARRFLKFPLLAASQLTTDTYVLLGDLEAAIEIERREVYRSVAPSPTRNGAATAGTSKGSPGIPKKLWHFVFTVFVYDTNDMVSSFFRYRSS